MKYITVGLLLITCFFGGMTYGTMETNHALGGEDEHVVKEEAMEMEPFTEESSQIAETPEMDEDTSIIHQAASWFEQMFLSIYSFCIYLLYSIADLFF